MRWEYKVVDYKNNGWFSSASKLQKELTGYGEDGWELVSAVPEVRGSGSHGDMDIETKYIKCIFKREK